MASTVPAFVVAGLEMEAGTGAGLLETEAVTGPELIRTTTSEESTMRTP
jgi:hypothetical protein